MKDLKSNVIDIRTKLKHRVACRQSAALKHYVPAPESKQRATTAIAPLQPQLISESSPSQQSGWQRLAVQAERINQLSAELEAAMFELKAIAVDVNCERRLSQNHQKLPQNSCRYLAAFVPQVECQQSGTFILNNRAVDLFRTEREATQLAQTLRRQAHKTRLASPPTRRRKLSVLSWLT